MKVLFQGDSITDAGRDRSNIRDMGPGYPKFASAMITDAFPDIDFEFFNIGISGNRTEHLVARLQKDFLDIQPDLVILMIGVNGVGKTTSIGKIAHEYAARGRKPMLAAAEMATSIWAP
jgi:lysophospholipase L1-like esterase